ncbi:hypothetical protein UFOVP211_53 [uncultured Caudovirales phage]|uniref:Uncharacterized protein n=1 Tax=uncultured Caudovirales phage TaxID=2100421 RepID=A0A6J7WPN8_9CAUD|nr:hypothetical protein UFOVP211_53 [uncultured Caudovirales phage]
MAIDINIDSQIKEYANLAAFPVTGVTKTIYIAKDTDISYYWDGAYIQLGSSAQDLQSVTDEGSVTNNNINIVDETHQLELSPQYILFSHPDNSISQIKSDATTNNLVFQLPNKNTGTYTLATTNDITDSQDLQNVTDNGATTTNSITVDSPNYFSIIEPSDVGTQNKDTGAYTYIGANGAVGIKTSATGEGTIQTSNITNNVTLEFPNKPVGTYTIATTEDTSTQVQSDWTQTDNTQVDYIKNKPSALTALGYYAQYQDGQTQTAAASNVGYPMKFRTMDLSNEVYVVSDSRITFTNSGVYNLQFSSQFQNTDTQLNDVTIWLRKNGTDVEGSSGYCSVPNKHGGINGHSIVAWNYLIEVNANDYYEIVWSTTNHTQVTMQYYAAGNPPPSTASTIFTVTQQAGVMAETQLDRLHSFASPYDYNGHAAQGSATSAAVWTITRLTLASNGTTTKGVATGSWDNRASLTYI